MVRKGQRDTRSQTGFEVRQDVPEDDEVVDDTAPVIFAGYIGKTKELCRLAFKCYNLYINIDVFCLLKTCYQYIDAIGARVICEGMQGKQEKKRVDILRANKQFERSYLDMLTRRPCCVHARTS